MLSPSVQDRTRWWSFEDVLLILLLGALLYLPGLGDISLFDRDEPRFATAARTMADTGDFVVPRFNGELRPDKPPLIYWAMTAAYAVVGENELGARLPSAIFATLTLLVVYFAAGSRFGRVTGIVASLILGTCGLFVAEARLATADATMIFFITLSMACAWRAWDAGNQRPGSLSLQAKSLNQDVSLDEVQSAVRSSPVPLGAAILFWLSLGLGALTKGVPLLFVLLPLLTLSIATAPVWSQWRKYSWTQRLAHLPELLVRALFRGNWRWWTQLRPWLGIPVLLLVVGAWVAAVWVATDPPGELLRLMYQQQEDRVLSKGTITTYKQPPGFYFALVWITFWPWTPLLIPAAYHAFKRMLGRTALAIDPRPYQFLVAWILPTWIVYELIRSKLPHYTLPLYIPIAILAADTLVQSWLRLTDVLNARWIRVWSRWIWGAVWVFLAAGILLFTRYLVVDHTGEVFWRAVPLAGAFLATGVAGVIAWNRAAWPFVTVLGWGLSLALLNASLLPHIAPLQVSKLAMTDAMYLRTKGYLVGAAGYNEPTLVFYNNDGNTLPMVSSPLDVRQIWSDSPKQNATPEDTFGNPDVATVVITDDRGYQALLDAGITPHVYYSYPGLRTDNLQWLRDAFSAAGGKPAKPLRQFAVYVLTNRDPTPPKTQPVSPATTRSSPETPDLPTQPAPLPAQTAPATTPATTPATAPTTP